MATLLRRDNARLNLTALAIALVTGLLTLGTACENASDPATTAGKLPQSRIELGQIACLTTQWYPITTRLADETENRLVRELVRQGVLLAAREELGLATRDETLGEPFPQSGGGGTDATPPKPLKPLEVWLEVSEVGTWQARLFGAGTERDNPIWQHQDQFDFDGRTMYAQLATQIAESCTEIAERLRKGGATGQRREPNPENKPSDDVEQWLVEMNFVSQYAAVRAAHRAMADDGPSLTWMGILVRGYAHLALLTEHTWSSHTEAFAARSLLYAERMIQQDDGRPLAQWHRAYARAAIGMHGAAIDQLDALAEARAADELAHSDTHEAVPAWSKLIEPYTKFQHARLRQVAADHPELSETAALLQWNLHRSYLHGRWIYTKGLEAMAGCPEAYGVYSLMADWPALVTKRTGVSRGVAAFGERLPSRVAGLSDVPTAIHALVADFDEHRGAFGQSVPSNRPARIAQLLRKAAREDETPSECSWAILADLIAEEQFVEAANLLRVSSDAVERSLEPLVEQLLPLVDGHQYVSYIRTYLAAPDEAERTAEFLSGISVRDPRPAMRQLFAKAWRTPMAGGRNGYEHSVRAIWSRNITHQGLVESWHRTSAGWVGEAPPEEKRKFANQLRQVSPYSPNALRLQWETAEAVDMEQLVAWEQELGNDPEGWLTMARAFYGLGYVEAAAQRFQRSLDISPSYEATEGLAYCHYYSGRKDLWQSALEEYLKEEDLSLNHARIHQRIADELIADRKWKDAEPHALGAAQTYSSWGLLLASGVYEGMQDWAKSEYFAAQATQSYPSYSTGTDWFFWCRRTGQGDLEAAHRFAKQSISNLANPTRRDDADRVLVYRLLEDGAKNALAEYEQQVARYRGEEGTWDTAWRLLHTIIVAGETNDAHRKQLTIAELRKLTQEAVRNTDPDWVEVLDGLCQAFEGDELDEAFLASYYETISKGPHAGRCNYSYFMGVALDQQGRTELAELFWRRAAFGGPFEAYNATLAGDRLVKRHGPDRGGLPKEFLTQEAEIATQQDADAQDAENGESDDSI